VITTPVLGAWLLYPTIRSPGNSAPLHRTCVDYRKRPGRMRCGFTRLPIAYRDPMLRPNDHAPAIIRSDGT
jgi:hypothetical protein